MTPTPKLRLHLKHPLFKLRPTHPYLVESAMSVRVTETGQATVRTCHKDGVTPISAPSGATVSVSTPAAPRFSTSNVRPLTAPRQPKTSKGSTILNF